MVRRCHGGERGGVQEREQMRRAWCYIDIILFSAVARLFHFIRCHCRQSFSLLRLFLFQIFFFCFLWWLHIIIIYIRNIIIQTPSAATRAIILRFFAHNAVVRLDMKRQRDRATRELFRLPPSFSRLLQTIIRCRLSFRCPSFRHATPATPLLHYFSSVSPAPTMTDEYRRPDWWRLIDIDDDDFPPLDIFIIFIFKKFLCVQRARARARAKECACFKKRKESRRRLVCRSIDERGERLERWEMTLMMSILHFLFLLFLREYSSFLPADSSDMPVATEENDYHHHNRTDLNETSIWIH